MIDPSPARTALDVSLDRVCFARNSLFVPFQKDRGTQSIASLFFDQAKWLTLPAPIHVPKKDKEYQKACAHVFANEKSIHSHLVKDRALLTEGQRSTFDSLLLASPVTQNLLNRMRMAQVTGKFMGAGIYLGTEATDTTIKTILPTALLNAYDAVGLSPSDPRGLQAACDLWGINQISARMSILNATWNALVSSPTWQMPEGFARNMSRLLEHEFPSALRNRNPHYQLDAETCDAFDIWFSEVKILHEQQLHNTRHDLLQNPRAPHVPSEVYCEEGAITEIIISNKQALNYWSHYLTISTLKSVEVTIPAELSVDTHAFSEKKRTDFAKEEILALSKTPLAPFISAFRMDIRELTPLQTAVLLMKCLDSLSALAESDTWRASSHTQTVRCILSNVSSEVKDRLQGILHSPTRHGALLLHDPMIYNYDVGNFSVVIPVALGRSALGSSSID